MRVASTAIISANAYPDIVFSDYEPKPHFSYHRAHTN